MNTYFPLNGNLELLYDIEYVNHQVEDFKSYFNYGSEYITFDFLDSNNFNIETSFCGLQINEDWLNEPSIFDTLTCEYNFVLNYDIVGNNIVKIRIDGYSFWNRAIPGEMAVFFHVLHRTP